MPAPPRSAFTLDQRDPLAEHAGGHRPRRAGRPAAHHHQIEVARLATGHASTDATENGGQTEETEGRSNARATDGTDDTDDTRIKTRGTERRGARSTAPTVRDWRAMKTTRSTPDGPFPDAQAAARTASFGPARRWKWKLEVDRQSRLFRPVRPRWRVHNVTFPVRAFRSTVLGACRCPHPDAPRVGPVASWAAARFSRRRSPPRARRCQPQR